MDSIRLGYTRLSFDERLIRILWAYPLNNITDSWQKLFPLSFKGEQSLWLANENLCLSVFDIFGKFFLVNYSSSSVLIGTTTKLRECRFGDQFIPLKKQYICKFQSDAISFEIAFCSLFDSLIADFYAAKYYFFVNAALFNLHLLKTHIFRFDIRSYQICSVHINRFE